MPWIEILIYLTLLAVCGASYLGGWFISSWYNNYDRRGKHVGSSRKKAGR